MRETYLVGDGFGNDGDVADKNDAIHALRLSGNRRRFD